MGRIPGKAEDACVAMFCQVLRGAEAKRRHCFTFLRGDPTPKRSKGTPLPVDAYFPEFKLVVEYMGQQHTTKSVLMDRRPGRKEQRAKYQQRRTEILAAEGYHLVRVWHHEQLTPELVRKKLGEVGIEPPAEGY